METRANHLLIGSFVLLVLAAGFGFVIWLAKVEIDREFAYYRIIFDGAVSGLSVGGDVRYNGIPVGIVTEITIDPDDPSLVDVIIEVGSNTPIRTDTVASLEVQGITGVSFVQLSGGSPQSPILEATDDELPVIASIPSPLQELFAGAPELINRVIILVERLSLIVNQENRAAIGNIINNISALSDRIAGRGEEFEGIIVNMNALSGDLNTMVVKLNGLIDTLDRVAAGADDTLAVARGTLTTVDAVIDNDLPPLFTDVRAAAGSIDRLSRQIETYLIKHEAELDLFASQGVVEFTRLIEDARLLVASTSRLLEDLESDPRQFLFGDRTGEVLAE